jgi:hypothetical protein
MLPTTDIWLDESNRAYRQDRALRPGEIVLDSHRG